MNGELHNRASASHRAPASLPPSVALRPFRSSDAAFIIELASDERVTRYVGDGRPWDRPYTEGRIQAALRDGPLDQDGATRWFLAVVAGDPVGLLVAMRRTGGVEIGYWVSPGHWGRGIAGAMVDAAVATVPALYGTDALTARVHPDNAVSARLLTRRGFRPAGHHEGVDHYRKE